MAKRPETRNRAFTILEVAFVALLGWMVVTSNLASWRGETVQAGAEQQKGVPTKKQKRALRRYAPVEGLPEPSPRLLGDGATTLACETITFESGTAEGFSTVPIFGTPLVLWHVNNGLCRADLAGHTTPFTFYYGQDGTCNYNTGARNASNLISPNFSLSSFFPPFSVNFNYLLFVEGGGFDSTFVDLSTDDGATWTQILSKANFINDNQWHNIARDITSLVGAATAVRLRYRFDSVDNIANSTTGWHVDDVAVCGSKFNLCIQDDSTGAVFKYSSITGDYLFDNCNGTVVEGQGTLLVKGSVTTLTDNEPDRRVLMKVDRAVKRGTASIQLLSPSKLFTITDRNTADDTCECPL